MKKIFALLLAVLMVVSLAACNNNEQTPSTPTDSTQNSGEVTNPGEGEIPELSDHENLMLDVLSKIEMPYPVMTWAIDVKNAEQVAYYMDADASKMVSITLTETAYEMDATLAEHVFSIMYVKVTSADVAETVAQDIIDGFKLERWNGQTTDNVNMDYEVVEDCIIIVTLGKSETAYTVDALLEAFKNGLNGAEITLKPEKTPVNPTEPDNNNANGETNTDSTTDATSPDESVENKPTDTTESTETSASTDATN